MEVGDVVFERLRGTKGKIVDFKPGYAVFKPFPEYEREFVSLGKTGTIALRNWMFRYPDEDGL